MSDKVLFWLHDNFAKIVFVLLGSYLAFYGFEAYNFAIQIGVFCVFLLLLDIRNFLEGITKEIIKLNEGINKIKDKELSPK